MLVASALLQPLWCLACLMALVAWVMSAEAAWEALAPMLNVPAGGEAPFVLGVGAVLVLSPWLCPFGPSRLTSEQLLLSSSMSESGADQH